MTCSNIINKKQHSLAYFPAFPAPTFFLMCINAGTPKAIVFCGVSKWRDYKFIHKFEYG
jgi:hypothetical protein